MNFSLLFLLLGLYFTALGLCILGGTQYVEPSTAASLCLPEVKKAMLRMGPYKDYRLFPGEGGRLEVRVGEEYLRLQY